MTELMFGWVTHKPNPIAGAYSEEQFCINNCVYCYATEIKLKHPEWDKYKGPYRLEASELKEYPEGSIAFIQDMGDIGDPSIPATITGQVLEYIKAHPKVTYLILTKMPSFYLNWVKLLRDATNIIYGVTIETNTWISSSISKAPSPQTRFQQMIRLRHQMPEARILVCVEPIMRFHLTSFETSIRELRPELVCIGYCNHGHQLPEPSLEETKLLIDTLEKNGIKVYQKTMRKAWWE